MPLDKAKDVANDSLLTPYVTVNNNITPLGTSTFTQLAGAQTSRPAKPAIGNLFYDTTTNQLEVYTVNGWVNPATAPSAPSNVTVANQAIAYGGLPAVTVNFTPATTGNPATSYTVTSSTGGFTATGTSSPITIAGLTAGTSYTFAVTAINAYGSAASSASNSLVAATVPQAPTIGTATVSSTSASVTFTPGNNGGASSTTYTVYASGGYGQYATGTSSPITVSGLTVGQSYTFTVTASNSAGTSSASSPSNSITAVTPFTVDYLIVGGGGGGGTTDSSRGSFANPASWSGGGGAGGYVNGSTNLTSLTTYNISIGAGSGPGGLGGNTTFNGLTALGGGYGGNSNSSVVQNGVAGGSGGGGGGDVPGLVYPNSGIGGASTQASTYGYGNGNAGGNGYDPSPERPGGGGGAGAAGAAGPASSGGNGLQWLDGNYYAGGGGGNSGTIGITTNTGGLGGGGNGSTGNYTVSSNATNATANTGGGGAGGTSGGSGICIIRYPGGAAKATGGIVTITGGYVYHTFNGNGSFVPNGTNPLASITSATLTNWYDFSGTTYGAMSLSSSTIVSATDLSNNGRNLTGSSATLLTNQINGLSAAYLPSGAYFSIANPITYSTPSAHMFIVWQQPASHNINNNGMVGGLSDPGILAWCVPGTTSNGGQQWLNTGRYWFGAQGSFTSYSTSRAYQLNASLASNGNFVYRQSRTADGSGTQSFGSGFSTPTNAIGYQEAGYAGANIIGEVIIFNQPLSSADLTTVENYLYSKWGV